MNNTVPPVYHMPQTAQTVTLIVFGASAVALGAYAVYLSATRRSMLPVIFWFAGAASVFLEPVADIMGNAVHSQSGADTVFTVKGHPIPLHIVLAYPWYFGAMQILLFDKLRAQSISKATWWTFSAAGLVAVTAVEQIPLHYHVWHYYGPQPLKIGYMPIGMIFANVASVMLPAIVIYKLMPVLKGWRQLLVIGIVPAFAMAGHAGAGLLYYDAVGTRHVSSVVLQAAGIGTMVLAAIVIWTALELCYGRAPAPDQGEPVPPRPRLAGPDDMGTGAPTAAAPAAR